MLDRENDDRTLPALPSSQVSAITLPDSLGPDPSFAGDVVDAYPERGNLYRLQVSPQTPRLYLTVQQMADKRREIVRFRSARGATPVQPSVKNMKRALPSLMVDRAKAAGFKMATRDSLIPRIVDSDANLVPQASRRSAPKASGLGIYPAYDLQVLFFGGAYFLCVDHHILVRNGYTLSEVTKHDSQFRLEPSQRVFVRTDETWQAAKFLSADENGVRVALADGDELTTQQTALMPDLTRQQIARLAPLFGIDAGDLERLIKQLSFLTTANAPLARLDACSDLVRRLGEAAFPATEGRVTVALDMTPAALRPPYFVVGRDLAEPEIALDHVDRSKRSRDIISGLKREAVWRI
jgi:hypothetical protein